MLEIENVNYIEHTSITQLNMYLRCPAQYYFRYIEGIIIPPNSAITRGKVVHKGNEINYKQKIKTHKDMKLSDLKEAVADEFDRQALDTEFTPDEDKGKLKDHTINLATLYHTNIAANIQPIAVEKEIYIPIANTMLKGYVDVVDDKGYIRDTKTANRTPNGNIADKSLQLTGYALAYRIINKKPENGVILDYLIDTKVPKVITLKSKRTDWEIKRFCSILYQILNAIQNGIFYPNETSCLCSPKWCGYWDICHKEYGGMAV